MSAPARTLDPSLDYCDLCGATVWRIVLVEVPDALVRPRILRWLRARLSLPEGGRIVMSVPACEPCANLLGFDETMDLPDDPAAAWAHVQRACPGQYPGAAAEDALLRLMRRYEEAFLP